MSTPEIDPAKVRLQLEALARRELGVPTLRERGRDALDFHDLSVHSLARALEAAYRLGRQAPAASAGGELEASVDAGSADQAASLEAEVLRNLADHAKFEANVTGACDGSVSAQKAACLEWLACGAEYQQMLIGGPAVNSAKVLAAEQNLVKQFQFSKA